MGEVGQLDDGSLEDFDIAMKDTRNGERHLDIAMKIRGSTRKRGKFVPADQPGQVGGIDFPAVSSSSSSMKATVDIDPVSIRRGASHAGSVAWAREIVLSF
jgi:hypothetical protein